MAVILNNQRPIGDIIGQGLGQGVGQGLNYLLENKLSNMRRQQQVGRYAPALQQLGLPQELAHLDEGLLKPILSEAYKNKLNAPKEEAYANIARQLLGGQQPNNNQIGEQEAMEQDQNIPQNITNANQGKAPIELPEGARLNERQLGKVIDIGQKQQALSQRERHFKETKEQRGNIHNEKLIADYRKTIEPHANVARNLLRDISEASKIVKTGKAVMGVFGKFTPDWLQSNEGQRLIQLLQGIVNSKAQTGKGTQGKFRLLSEQAAKGQIYNQPEVIEEYLNYLAGQPDLLTAIAKEDALNEIESSSKKAPGNISGKVLKQVPERVKQLQQAQKSQEDLPEGNYEDGSPVVDGDAIRSNGQEFERVNGQWRAA